MDVATVDVESERFRRLSRADLEDRLAEFDLGGESDE
jgi:hypothetical protein